MRNITIIIAVFLLISCNMSDYSEDLVGGYTFSHEGKDYNTIFGGNHTIYPNVLEYAFNDDFILVCQKPNKSLYLSWLASDLSCDYGCYNSYLKDSVSEKYSKSRYEILADSTIHKIFKHRNISFENTSEDIKKGEEIADSIIQNNPMHKKIFSLDKVFWIIKIKGDLLFGPFSKNEFKEKRKILKIDDDLNMFHNK